MRTLEVWAAGPIAPYARYASDQAMISRVAQSPKTALLRVSSSASAGLALGRFHRRDRNGDERLTRRTTGGRSTPIGPGLIEVTAALPAADWLDPAVASLRPEQVLNRALRPLLGLLRKAGVDAFYPGRDLITLDASPLAACSFTAMPDGVVLVDVCLGTEEPLSVIDDRVARLDPGGAAAITPRCFDGAVDLSSRLDGAWEQGRWVDLLADSAGEAWRCAVNRPTPAPGWLDDFMEPDRSAYDAFLCERVPQTLQDSPGSEFRSAATIAMLGVVEADVLIVDGRMHDLEISGDVIAPSMTLTALSDACEGAPAAAPALRRAVTSVLAEQRHFLLGLDDVDELLCRLV